MAVVALILFHPATLRASDAADAAPPPNDDRASPGAAVDPGPENPASADRIATDPLSTDPIAAGTEPAERGRFASATRTFFQDGGYLFTFPTRVTPRGLATTGAWGGATLLALHNDDWVAGEISSQKEPDRDHTARNLEPLGRMPLQAGVLGILWAGGKMADNEGLASTAATSFEALLWAGIVSNGAKMMFGRQQPGTSMDARYFFEGQGSFPSGHATRSFAIAAVMADRYGARGAWIGYGLAGVVSLSMMQRGIHWASDVVAGAGLGYAVGKGIAFRHPGPNSETALGGGTPKKTAWQFHPARDGAALTLTF